MSPVALDRSARIREGMRRAAAERLAEAELKHPQYSKPDEEAGPRPDDSAHLAQAYAHEWAAAIHFHAARGMSRGALARIYGRDAVTSVLGGYL